MLKKLMFLLLPVFLLLLEWILFPAALNDTIGKTSFYRSLIIEILSCLIVFVLIGSWKRQMIAFELSRPAVICCTTGLILFLLGIWLWCLFSTVPRMLFATRKLYVFVYLIYSVIAFCFDQTKQWKQKNTDNFE